MREWNQQEVKRSPCDDLSSFILLMACSSVSCPRDASQSAAERLGNSYRLKNHPFPAQTPLPGPLQAVTGSGCAATRASGGSLAEGSSHQEKTLVHLMALSNQQTAHFPGRRDTASLPQCCVTAKPQQACPGSLPHPEPTPSRACEINLPLSRVAPHRCSLW